MAEAIEAVREANSKIVTDGGFRLATEPKVVLPLDEAAVEKVITGKSEPRLHGRDGARTADRACRFQDRQTGAADCRSDRRGSGRGAARRDSPNRTGRLSPRRRMPRRAIASRLRSRARSAARRSKAAPAKTSPLMLGSGQFIPGFEDHLVGIRPATRDVRCHVPRRLPRPRRRRQRRHLCGHGEKGERPARCDEPTNPPRTSDWNRWPPCGSGSATRSRANTWRLPAAPEARVPGRAGPHHEFGRRRPGRQEFGAIWAQIEAELARK